MPSASHNSEGERPAKIRLGTRTSQLALWQTNFVADLLRQKWPDLTCELVHLITQGDKRLDRPLPEIGGKGLFTAELEDALRSHEIDMAVHSLKDLPVEDPADLVIGAILSRADARDVLVAREPWTVATLPQGAVVGTSSLRRQAQLLAVRPDLIIRSIRGNVDTRLRKVLSGEYDAAVMAGAGLTRLGLTEHITEWLGPDVMLPAPGQGALAVQCRANDAAILRLLAAVHDPDAANTTEAERRLLFNLGGGCSAPIGAAARIHDGQLTLHARVASADGRSVFEAEASGSNAHEVADHVAERLLAQGASAALLRDTAAADTNDPPLQGKRVVVTRPHRAGAAPESDLTHQLQLVGAEVIEVPAIELVPLATPADIAAALDNLASGDWIVFTSPNAVEFFWMQLEQTHYGTQPPQVGIAAVGPGTRATLEARGIPVDAMPEQYRGRAIVSVLGDLSGKRVLLPRSAQGARDLPDTLAEAGAMVDFIDLYAPVAAKLDPAVLDKLASGVDAVTFASGSAVRALVDTLASDPKFGGFWDRTLIACIGPATAAAAHDAGLAVGVVAKEHSVPGLVDALANHYRLQRAKSVDAPAATKESQHG